jgi:hypothetical protein
MAHILVIGDPNDLHTQQKVHFLASRGHHIRLLCTEQESMLLPKDSFIRPWIHDLPLPYFSWKNALLGRNKISVILDAITAYQSDLLLILYAEPHLGWAYYGQTIRIPIAVFCYGTDALVTLPRITQSWPMGMIRSALFRKAFQHVSLLLANSQAQLNRIHHLVPSDLQSQVVRIGVACDALDQFVNERIPRPISKSYVLFPRMMQPIYHHEQSIRAIQMLPEEIQSSYTFVFLDKDGTNTAYIADIENAMQLNPAVDFLWLPRLPKRTLWQYIQHAALCVQHPSSDGSAVTALETMYLGTPLLLGPADYDHVLFEQVPRTQLAPDEMAKNIIRMLEPRSNGDDRTLIRLNTDEKTQSIEMENLLMALVHQ